ncbi:MAG: sugar kinase [Candidatus Limnocylindrales bacterium]|jgi:2-dehydro-3-deoxygluconokinase
MSTSRKSFVAFGDLLVRLNPKGQQRIVQAEEFEVRFTGAEANVAVSLANFGVTAFVVSKVPDNDVGQACVNSLRRFGVKTDYVRRGGERLGLFYLETGASQRPSKVIYDRAHTAFAQSGPDDYDWAAILEGKDWFHFSGTAPALGSGVVQALEEGLAAAKARGLTVSCDLNYRAKLWSADEARRIMGCLVPQVDVLLVNEEDAQKVFGIRAAGSDVSTGRLVEESYRQVAVQLADRFDLRRVAITLRESISASANGWAGLLYDGGQHYVSRKYLIEPVIDRVGGGDSFAAGLIYGLLSGFEPQRCVDFAAAASCLKHTINGDVNLVSFDEVLALMGGDGSGRIQR